MLDYNSVLFIECHSAVSSGHFNKDLKILTGSFFVNLKVAERVAAERAEVCGNGKSSGYQIRLERYITIF